jgi:hypothetical protein
MTPQDTSDFDTFDEDFGLSGLTKYFTYPLKRNQAEGIELTELLAERYGAGYAQRVLADLQLLLTAPLPDEVLNTLWLGATQAHFDPQGEGIGIRHWLEQLANVCLARIRQNQVLPLPAAPATGQDEGLREAVLAELDGVGPALAEAVVTSLYAPPLPNLVPALRRVVTEVDPDLGFRLLLRALKAYFMPISEVRYQRFLSLGERFGYHELVVDDGNLNTWPDLVD